ncbi:hypothetical protein HMN09_00086200 [Mycena chlorophos]|uniref:Uncharacterized protein n=1 Tax=Mycena chlorophos TaxID=658473 RepID=A0A8H6TUI1_MYCCL|nr:hypothetical protein HMN09_00086200 [Mycena chlorophos]
MPDTATPGPSQEESMQHEAREKSSSPDVPIPTCGQPRMAVTRDEYKPDMEEDIEALSQLSFAELPANLNKHTSPAVFSSSPAKPAQKRNHTGHGNNMQAGPRAPPTSTNKRHRASQFSSPVMSSSLEKPQKKKGRLASPTVSQLEHDPSQRALVDDDSMDVDDQNDEDDEDEDEDDEDKEYIEIDAAAVEERLAIIIAKGHLRIHSDAFLASLGHTLEIPNTSAYENSMLFDASRGFSSENASQNLSPSEIQNGWRSNTEAWLRCPDTIGDAVDEPQYPSQDDGLDVIEAYISWNRDVYENLEQYDNDPGTTLAVRALKNILDISYVYAIRDLDKMQLESNSALQHLVAAERIYRLYEKFGPQIVIQPQVSRSALSKVTKEFDAVLAQVPAMACDRWKGSRFYSPYLRSETFARIPCLLDAV